MIEVMFCSFSDFHSCKSKCFPISIKIRKWADLYDFLSCFPSNIMGLHLTYFDPLTHIYQNKTYQDVYKVNLLLSEQVFLM